MTAFEELYEKHAKDLYRFALYLCGNHAEAEDLTSEAFVRAWNASGEIRAATAKSYLFTIVRNCFLSQRIRKSKHDQLDDNLADPAAGPYASTERKDQLDWALAALQELPEVDRTVLLLRVQEEMSYQEIADTVGLSMAAVKVRIHRARTKLSHKLTTENSQQ
jgi:RNA polymerase sigma-70 factor (ECF subfamily)